MAEIKDPAEEIVKIKEIIEAWQKGELSDCAAMCVHMTLYPATSDKEDIEWAKAEYKKVKEFREFKCNFLHCRFNSNQVNDDYCREHKKLLEENK